MRVMLHHRRGRIALIQVEPGKRADESNILAAMTQDEGTPCWQVYDVRLAQHVVPSPYSAEPGAENFHARHTPKDAEERAFYKAHLREYQEDANGTLHWCTFEGIVRGSPAIDGYAPAWRSYDAAGYFGRQEGLAELRKIQAFWEAYDGDPALAKIDNPLRQPTMTALTGEFFLHRLLAERASAEADHAAHSEPGSP